MPTTPPLPPLPEPHFRSPDAYTAAQMHAYVEADRRSRAPEGWVCVPREPTLEMEVSGEHEFFAYPGRSRSDWAAICGAAYRAMIAAAPVATPTEPAARAQAEELPPLNAAIQRLHDSIAWLRDGEPHKLGIGVADMVIIEAALRNREALWEALNDMHSGWLYIRSTHGDLYGVGWNRAQEKAESALEAYMPAIAQDRAARAQAEPVAWIVYLPSMQTQEIFDSQEDAGYVDWLTNYPDAEVTPLYTASQSEAVQVRATWRPIGTAPMDGTPILALCQHTADAYYDGDRLTDYGARSEGLSHVEDGPHVIVWGESYDVSDGWENPSCTIPAGWELSHDCEVMANPIGWMPVPGTAPAIPQPAATAGKAEGEVVPWGTGLLAREELANDGHVGAGPIAAPAGADTRRLDWLDAQRVAYGFADVHEGNGWEISGAYGSIRQAIDHESGTTGEASHG